MKTRVSVHPARLRPLGVAFMPPAPVPARRRTVPAWSSLLLGLGIMLWVGGCGYAHQPLYRADVTSMAAPIFDNQSFYRGAEFDLAEALVKELELRTPYKVRPVERADTLLEGTIVSIEQRQLSATRDAALPQELEVRVTANFQWKDARSGQVLREQRGLTAVGRYVPTRPLGQTYDLGQHQAMQALAAKIVWSLGSDW